MQNDRENHACVRSGFTVCWLCSRPTAPEVQPNENEASTADDPVTVTDKFILLQGESTGQNDIRMHDSDADDQG